MNFCFSSHFSCAPNWSKVFKTNTAGLQDVSERLFLNEIFTNGTNALAGKGLRNYQGSIARVDGKTYNSETVHVLLVKTAYYNMSLSFLVCVITRRFCLWCGFDSYGQLLVIHHSACSATSIVWSWWCLWIRHFHLYELSRLVLQWSLPVLISVRCLRGRTWKTCTTETRNSP